jgi:hypothetical protein
VDNAISIPRVAIVAHHPEERLVDIEAVVNLGRTPEHYPLKSLLFWITVSLLLKCFAMSGDGLPSNRSTVNLQRKGGSQGAKQCG